MSPKKARRAFEHKTATDECASNTRGATEGCDYATSVQIRRQDGWQDEPGSLLAGVAPHAFKDSLNRSSAFVGPIRRDLASCPSTGLLDRSRVVLAGPCSQRGPHRNFRRILRRPISVAHSPPRYWSTQFPSQFPVAVSAAVSVDQSPSPILRHVIGRRSFRHSFRRPFFVAHSSVMYILVDAVSAAVSVDQSPSPNFVDTVTRTVYHPLPRWDGFTQLPPRYLLTCL